MNTLFIRGMLICGSYLAAGFGAVFIHNKFWGKNNDNRCNTTKSDEQCTQTIENKEDACDEIIITSTEKSPKSCKN